MQTNICVWMNICLSTRLEAHSICCVRLRWHNISILKLSVSVWIHFWPAYFSCAAWFSFVHIFFKSIRKIEFLPKYLIHFSFTPSMSSSSQSNVYHPFFVRFYFDSNMLSWFHSTGNVMARACVCYISSLFRNWNQRSCELLKTECQLTIETKKTPAIIRRFLLFLCFVAVLRLEMWNWNKIQLQHLRAHMCGAKCFICWV